MRRARERLDLYPLAIHVNYVAHVLNVRHIDRHANIGEGYIGKAGFRRILATTAAIWKT